MYYLMTLNSAVNPFIYIAFNRELRRPLLRLFPFLTRYAIVQGGTLRTFPGCENAAGKLRQEW